MKAINKFFSFAAMAGAVIALSSCASEKIYGVDENGIANPENYQIGLTVDQETGSWTAELQDKNGNPATGVNGYWSVYSNGAEKSPVSMSGAMAKGLIVMKGEYPIEVKIGNHNGIADEALKANITINESHIDLTQYSNAIKGTWRMKHEVKGHLGCGEPGTNGLGWWAAGPDEKADFGVYENRCTFTPQDAAAGTGEYVFNPGESGTIYCNKDFTVQPFEASNPHDGNDYTAPVNEVTSTFTFSLEGTQLILTLGSESFLPYIPNADTYYNPKFRVDAMNKETLELTCDNAAIAWHYILCPADWEAPIPADVDWVGVDSEENLINGQMAYLNLWTSGAGWDGDVANPLVTIGGNDWNAADNDVETATFEMKGSNKMTFNYVDAPGAEQWKAQVKIKFTSLALDAEKTYAYRVKLSSDMEIPSATVKLGNVADNAEGGYKTGILVPANGGVDVEFGEVKAGLDPVMLVFDFGGSPAGCTITVSDIIIQEKK